MRKLTVKNLDTDENTSLPTYYGINLPAMVDDLQTIGRDVLHP